MYYSELMQRMDFCKAEGYYSMGFAEKSRLIMQFANEKRILQIEKNKMRDRRKILHDVMRRKINV